MSTEQDNRSRWLNIRLKPEEYKTINERFKKTTSRKMSEYSRNVLLEKNITVNYRNQSMDDVLEELILLRTELNFIGHNFNQAVKKLNSVSGMPDAPVWQAMLTVLRDEIEPSVRHIKERLNEFSDIWSRRLSAEKA